MYPITEEQQRWWKEYRDLRRSGLKPHEAVRKAALEFAKSQPDDTCLWLDTQRLQCFGEEFAKGPRGKVTKKTAHKLSKQAYLDHHSKDHIWGEDAILFPFLKALGFQTTIYATSAKNLRRFNLSQSFRIEPYEQNDYGLKITLINYLSSNGAGNHFDLSDTEIGRDGNCAYAAIGMQMERCLSKMKDKLIPSSEHKMAADEKISTDSYLQKKMRSSKANKAKGATKQDKPVAEFKKTSEQTQDATMEVERDEKSRKHLLSHGFSKKRKPEQEPSSDSSKLEVEPLSSKKRRT